MAEADVVEVEGGAAAAAEIAEQFFAGDDEDDEEEVEDEPEYLSESEQQQQEQEEEEEEEEELLTAEEELERYKEAMTKLIATTQQYQRDVEDEKRRAEDEHGAEVAGLLEELEAERALNSRLREENLANIRSVYAQIQEYERVNEERLRAALESGNEIVESVVKLKVSTRRGKPTEVVLLAPRPAADGGDGGDSDSDGEDGDKTRSAKELELAMQLRCLQKENQFLINKLSEQKQQHFEDIETERRVSEEAIGKVKELVASHMATLQRLDDTRKEADDAKRALQDARAEAEALRAQLRAAEMAQAMSTATAASASASKSKKPTWGQLARGKKQQQQQQQQQQPSAPTAVHVAAEDTSAPSPQQQQQQQQQH